MQADIIKYKGGLAADVSFRIYRFNDLTLTAGQTVPDWVQSHILPTTKESGVLSLEMSTSFLDFIVDSFKGDNSIGAVLLEMTRDPAYVSSGACPICTPEGDPAFTAMAGQTIGRNGYLPQVVLLNRKNEWDDAFVIGITSTESSTPYFPLPSTGRGLNTSMRHSGEIVYPIDRMMTEYQTKLIVGPATYTVGLGHAPRSRDETPKQNELPVDALLIYMNINRPDNYRAGASRSG